MSNYAVDGEGCVPVVLTTSEAEKGASKTAQRLVTDAGYHVDKARRIEVRQLSHGAAVWVPVTEKAAS